MCSLDLLLKAIQKIHRTEANQFIGLIPFKQIFLKKDLSVHWTFSLALFKKHSQKNRTVLWTHAFQQNFD